MKKRTSRDVLFYLMFCMKFQVINYFSRRFRGGTQIIKLNLRSD